MPLNNDNTDLSMNTLLQMEILQELRALRLQFTVVERLLSARGSSIGVQPVKAGQMAGGTIDTGRHYPPDEQTSAVERKPAEPGRARKRKKRSVITPRIVETILENIKLPPEKRKTRAELSRNLDISVNTYDRILKREVDKKRELEGSANRRLITLPAQVRAIKFSKDGTNGA